MSILSDVSSKTGWVLKLTKLSPTKSVYAMPYIVGSCFLRAGTQGQGAQYGVWIPHYSILTISLHLWVVALGVCLVPECISSPLTLFHMAFFPWLAVRHLFSSLLVIFRVSCSTCSCCLGVPMGGGELRTVLLHYFLLSLSSVLLK